MKTKSTAIWFVLAILLFAFICFWQKHQQNNAPVVLRLLPGLRIADVTDVEVTPAAAFAINADRTNGGWQLEKPFIYPAQTTAIETLLTALEKLTPALRITPAEISARKNTDLDFGFNNPQFRINLTAGGQNWQLQVGNKTAPGDQVFVRIVGTDGVFVTDVNWLQYLPLNATAWRDTSLMDTAANYDWIVITNGTKVIELHRDATNGLWRMTWPLTTARADSDGINAALQQLRSAQAARFVTDDPKTDLTTFGLQPADLDLRFGNSTNLTAGLHVGKATTDNPAQVFARRDGWNSIVAVAKDVFTPWRGGVNDFRDAHLFQLTAPVAEIEVRGKNNFTLQRHGTNDWTIIGEKFPVDADSVRDFIRELTSVRVAEFRKDKNTTTDLQGFGLDAASGTNQITLRATVGDTNSVIAQLIFGAQTTNQAYVKRADENYVYALTLGDFNNLKERENSWMYRDRRIWNFSETNVTQITLRQNGKTQTLLRTGANAWSPAPGSQGIIAPAAIEESVHRLGEIDALGGWAGRNLPATVGGFNTNNLSLTIELKTGEKLSVDFGMELTQANTAVAAVTLDGDRWVFVFPPATYQYVLTYLTLPPDKR